LRTVIFLSVLLIAVLLSGCAGVTSQPETVVVYASEDRIFAEPILHDFSKATGIAVQAVYESRDSRSARLVDRLIAEQRHPQADVYWASDPLSAELLKWRGISQPYTSPNAEGIPDQFRDPDGHWTGFAARAWVILANRELEDQPEGLASFTDSRHRGLAAIVDPRFGSAAVHMAALFNLWGNERASAFLDAMKRNGVKVSPSDAECTALVVSGKAGFALVSSDSAVSCVRRHTHVGLVFPDQLRDDPGVLLIPDAAVVIRGAEHLKSARALVDDLLSRETERRLAFDDCARIPLHHGIETPPEIRRIEALHVMKVDFPAIARKLPQILPPEAR
jgi:iron(III) transport system substrate-binding protein